jgi:hypothetical protein
MLMFSVSGRTMTKTPMKPTITLDQRLTPTTSFRKKMARIVVNRVRTKLIAVTSARGRCTTAINPVSIAMTDTLTRSPSSSVPWRLGRKLGDITKA